MDSNLFSSFATGKSLSNHGNPKVYNIVTY